MKINNFIWDFDGTIIDTYPHSATAFVNTMKEYGIEVDYDRVIWILRNSFSGVKSAYNLSDEQFLNFLNNALVLWFEPNPTMYEGIDKVLERIVLSGGKNFLYTNRNQTAVQYLNHFGLLKYFTECVCNDTEGYARKPAPDSVEYIVEKHSLCKDETAMVGDREIDVLSGKMADCKAILFDEFNLSKETCADAVIYDIRNIKDFIA